MPLAQPVCPLGLLLCAGSVRAQGADEAQALPSAVPRRPVLPRWLCVPILGGRDAQACVRTRVHSNRQLHARQLHKGLRAGKRPF